MTIDELKKRVAAAEQDFSGEAARVRDGRDLTALRDAFLGRKNGLVSGLMTVLRELEPEQRPAGGQEINRLKSLLENRLAELGAGLADTPRRKTDYSLPEAAIPVGRRHLISSIRWEVENVFLNLGYSIVEGPEIETEFHNFTALNIPEHHPARNEQDTFFIEGGSDLLLRTHTSPVQIRHMLKNRPPIKVISPGKVFRKDEPDATHTPVFHQVEGFLVDRGISFADLKGTLQAFTAGFFGPGVTVRFRPSYFPFTEPSAEVDISCVICAGEKPDCRVCRGSGWLEILGCGMVHPAVLGHCGIDAAHFNGFAFGMGLERIAMIKYGLVDIRMLYENDLRFNRQFG